jgi:hypothetical protein
MTIHAELAISIRSSCIEILILRIFLYLLSQLVNFMIRFSFAHVLPFFA